MTSSSTSTSSSSTSSTSISSSSGRRSLCSPLFTGMVVRGVWVNHITSLLNGIWEHSQVR